MRPFSSRLALFALLAVFAVVAGRIALLAEDAAGPAAGFHVADSTPSEPVRRAAVVDRDGRLLAVNIPGWSLAARPGAILDARTTAAELARLLDLDGARLEADISSNRPFVWVAKRVTPGQKNRIEELGLTGLVFHKREMRAYPGGRATAHLVGGVRDQEVERWGARMLGVGGIEGAFDADLSQGGEPLQLSIRQDAQAALHDAMQQAVSRQRALGGAGVLMDARTGEIHAMVSLPDFNPNQRPAPSRNARPELDPLFNRAAQGVYELGSVSKVITVGLASEFDDATLETTYSTRPFRVGGYLIREPYIKDAHVTLLEIVQRSSNVGSAVAALSVGGERQQAFFESLGLLDPLPVELPEARGSQPLYPRKWTDLSTATISYGHGVSFTPMHLAAAYATLAGSGRRIRPTLLLRDGGGVPEGAHVVSERTVRNVRAALRSVVQTRRGTGRRAEVAGYDVGGKTGTAEKPDPVRKRYHDDKVLSTFVSAFPMHDPRFVLVVVLDEPQGEGDARGRRQAGRTAAPIAREVISRIGILYGMVSDELPAELAADAADGVRQARF